MTDPRTGWTQGQFESWDKEKIFFRIWSPPGARGTLVIIHGFGEHSGRYEKFASRMEGLPVQIAVMDLRGMGRSGGKRVSAASMEDYLKDMTAFKVCLERDFAARVPMILLGHSLGGLLAVEWASRYPESIKTLILTSPFLGLKGLPLLRLGNYWVRRFCPGFVYKNPVVPKRLTHDPVEVAGYRNDPLIERRISAQLGELIMERLARIEKRHWDYPFPVYVLVAGEERIVDLNAIRRFFGVLRAPKKELIEFEGFYHEIFHEAEQQKVFNVLKTIIEDCV